MDKAHASESTEVEHHETDDKGYEVKITGRHLMVTEAMKQHALDKISKLERITKRLLDIHIIMDIQKMEHRVDIIVRFNHIKIKVQAHSSDMYNSIDKAVEKLQAQIRRYKEKLQQHQAKSISVVDMNVNVIGRLDALDEFNDEIERGNERALEQSFQPSTVVKKEIRPLKTLTQDEAIMKMELSSDSFLLYRCEEDQKLKLIYQREDGNFGIIEPE